MGMPQCQLPRAAITKCHRLGGLKRRAVILTILIGVEAGGLR